jgi:hypothetical protein
MECLRMIETRAFSKKVLTKEEVLLQGNLKKTKVKMRQRKKRKRRKRKRRKRKRERRRRKPMMDKRKTK